ncbi:MAG: alpha/beta fold hydrolase, partial [Acidobacteriota bacterium]|nr:alpha/beta fold hydrolase [Acidobacteriota bacterium]
MKKFRQAFGPQQIFHQHLINQHRLLFLAVAFVFAVAVGARQLESHARAGTSPAPTNPNAAVLTYSAEAGSTNSTGVGRAYSIEVSSIEARDLPSADKKSEGESRFAKLDLGAGQKPARVHYVNYGKGKEALVLIHGWTMNVDNWRDQIPDFARRSRVIAIDLPGHGQSDKPQTTYSMDLFARAVDAVMRDAKVKRAVLVGHSMGTPVVRQFYRKYPQKTLAIVIVDGALRPFGDKAMMDRIIEGFRGPDYQKTGAQMFAA